MSKHPLRQDGCAPGHSCACAAFALLVTDKTRASLPSVCACVARRRPGGAGFRRRARALGLAPTFSLFLAGTAHAHLLPKQLPLVGRGARSAMDVAGFPREALPEPPNPRGQPPVSRPSESCHRFSRNPNPKPLRNTEKDS